jgi:pyruvate dehydrogenase E2 component (dihydrolipoamide acetyltransferase)
VSRQQFRLPDLGEGLTEGEIVAWLVAPGDTVTLNQPIVEIETAKAVVEVPSPYAGVVVTLHAEAGRTLDVGAPLLTVDVGGDGSAPNVDVAEQAERREAVLVGYGVRTGAPRRRARRTVFGSHVVRPTVLPGQGPGVAPPGAGGTPPAPRAPGPVGNAPPAAATGAPAADRLIPGHERPLAKPPVRKLARALGVDLTAVAPTGAGGVITREDVQRAAVPVARVPQSVRDIPFAAQPLPPSYDPTREQRIPIKGVRKLTADAVVRSAYSAPHVTEFMTVDVTPLMDLVRQLRADPDFAGVKVTPLMMFSWALIEAIRRNPLVNATWDEHAQEIVVKSYVNLGIAAATPRGLLVPNVKDAQDLTLRDLCVAIASLAETAKAGKTPPADLQHGTITITNVGVFGVDTGTPIINPGEALILALGVIRPQPWVHEGEIAIRSVTTVAVSFDHRMMDGAEGSKVLADLAHMLSDASAFPAWR